MADIDYNCPICQGDVTVTGVVHHIASDTTGENDVTDILGWPEACENGHTPDEMQAAWKPPAQ